MPTLGIDGMVSGLDTTSLINQLMQVEAMPQTLLKTKQTTTESFVGALRGLNTRIVSLGTTAGEAAKAESWQAVKASSTATATASATVSAGAQPGSVTFTVDKVATARVAVSAEVRDDGTLGSGPITVAKGDGTFVTVEPASNKLADIAKAINDSGTAGVKATVVRVSDGATPTYRLQLTATETGSAGTFALHLGRQADVSPATRLDVTQVRAAEDAQVTLWKGVVGLEKQVTQSSNTFKGLMTGVDVTIAKVTKADEEPVTISVSRDDAALKKLASGLVGALGVVLSEIASQTKTTTTTTDGKTTVVGGRLTGDSAVRQITQQLTDAVAYPVDGVAPSTLGIVLGKDGSFTFDEAKFSAALAADPAKVQKVVSGLAARVAEKATAISDPYEGSLSQKVKGQESLVKDIGSQIENWDRRLEVRRASLQRTYSALEVSLSNLQSQSSWLAGQLATLPKMSS